MRDPIPLPSSGRVRGPGDSPSPLVGEGEEISDSSNVEGREASLPHQGGGDTLPEGDGAGLTRLDALNPVFIVTLEQPTR